MLLLRSPNCNFRTWMSGKDVHTTWMLCKHRLHAVFIYFSKQLERLHPKPMKNGLCWISFEKERLATEFQNKRLPSLKRDESLIFRGTTLIQISACADSALSSVNGDEPLSPTQNHTSACSFSDKAPRSVPYIPLPPHTNRRLSENKTACTIPFPCIFIYILLYQIFRICQGFPMIS